MRTDISYVRSSGPADHVRSVWKCLRGDWNDGADHGNYSGLDIMQTERSVVVLRTGLSGGTAQGV